MWTRVWSTCVRMYVRTKIIFAMNTTKRKTETRDSRSAYGRQSAEGDATVDGVECSEGGGEVRQYGRARGCDGVTSGYKCGS